MKHPSTRQFSLDRTTYAVIRDYARSRELSVAEAVKELALMGVAATPATGQQIAMMNALILKTQRGFYRRMSEMLEALLDEIRMFQDGAGNDPFPDRLSEYQKQKDLEYEDQE